MPIVRHVKNITRLPILRCYSNFPFKIPLIFLYVTYGIGKLFLYLIMTIHSLLQFVLFNTRSLVVSSLQKTFNILLRNHNSEASSLLMMVSFKIHPSTLKITVDQGLVYGIIKVMSSFS